MKYGLQELKEDNRDLKLGYIFNLPKLEELPNTFIVGEPEVVHQKDSYFCAAASSCSISELQEGEPLGYEWVYAVAKMLDGQIEIEGTDLRTICKVHTKYGAIGRDESPYSLENKPVSFLERIENWPKNLFDLAKKHKKKTYVQVSGQYDPYDTIRASLWKFRDEKRAVLIGVKWSWPLERVFIDSENDYGGGHALHIIGWNKKGLIVQNSYGEEAGLNGRHYFSREIINKYVSKYGAYMFVDLDPEKAKWYQENEIKVGDSWLMAFGKVVKKLLASLLFYV
jgi:hypothetical protein